MHITPDSLGFIWISSFEGLKRFDGTHVKTYSPVLPNGKKDLHITSPVFQDQKNNLWFSTLNAIHCLFVKEDSIVTKQLSISGKDSPVSYHSAFHLDKASNLWVYGEGQLMNYNILSGKTSYLHPFNGFTCYAIKDEQEKVTGLVKPLMVAPFGIEIISYEDQYTTYKTSRYFSANDSSGLPTASVFFLFVENDTTIWLPSSIGLIKFNPKKPKDYTLFEMAGTNFTKSFCDIHPWGKDYLWAVSSQNGIYLYHRDGRLIRRDTAAWINNNLIDLKRVNNVIVDSKQNLWLATWDRGIVYTNLKNRKVKHLLPPQTFLPIQKKTVSTIVEDLDNRLWCGLPEEGLFVFDRNDKMTTKYNRKTLYPNSIRDRPIYLHCDAAGDVWVLSYNTILLWERATGKFHKKADGLEELREIKELENNRFLIISFEKIFEARKNEHNFELVEYKLPLTEKNYNHGFVNRKKQVFIPDGIDSIFIFSTLNNGFHLTDTIDHTGFVNGMAEDETNGDLWFATSKGLLSVNSNSYSEHEYVSDELGKLNQSFNDILLDDSMTLWMSTNSGIISYSLATKKVREFESSDGLAALPFQFASGAKTSSGRLSFGGANGLNIFHPEKLKLNSNEPIIHITDIVVNYKTPLSGVNPLFLDSWRFPFSQNTITFDFIAIEFSAPSENVLKYRIKNYDPNWVAVPKGLSGTASYPNLPPGNYVFEIQAANSDGVWVNEPKIFNFTILSPWYRTWWAYLTYFLSATGLLYSYYRFRINQIRKEESFKRKEVEYKQLVAETETAVLRLQMNPHFIFNSMNSISSYILTRDIETANDYLGRFAQLMRMILDYAAKPLIEVADEVELLELYLQAEAMRFEGRFDYCIDYEDEFDPDEYRIPPMILQPFVENAILHGFTGKKEKGLIKVSFREAENCLYCSVQDNGIGRKAAAKTNRKAKSHESKALNITQRRMELLERKNGVIPTIQFIDLYHDDKIPAGTKVLLRFPVL